MLGVAKHQLLIFFDQNQLLMKSPFDSYANEQGILFGTSPCIVKDCTKLDRGFGRMGKKKGKIIALKLRQRIISIKMNREEDI